MKKAHDELFTVSKVEKLKSCYWSGLIQKDKKNMLFLNDIWNEEKRLVRLR